MEVSAIGYGRSPGTNRHVDTILGKRLRYVSHDDTGSTLRIVQEEPETGLRVTSVFEARAGVRAWSEASLTRPGELVLDFLSSLVVGLESVDADLYSATNDWMAENARRAVLALGRRTADRSRPALPRLEEPARRDQHRVVVDR